MKKGYFSQRSSSAIGACHTTTNAKRSKRKRPRGLKRSAEAAAAAVTPTVEEVANSNNAKRSRAELTNDEEEQAEVMISAGIDEELNEIEEAHSLVSAAIALIDEGDREQAQTLMQGAVHEYDRLMQTTPDEERDSEFYRFYGDALRELGGILHDQEFVAASLTRYETALEKNPANLNALISMGKMALNKAQLAASEKDAHIEIDQGTERLILGIKELGLAEQAHVLSTFALQLHEFADDDESPNLDLVTKAETLFTRAIELDSSCHSAYAGLGLCIITRINTNIDETQEEDQEVEEKDISHLSDQGIEFLEKALSQLGNADDDANRARYLCWLGEAYVLKGNNTDEEEADNIYAIAASKLRQAHKIDENSLPEGLRDFLEQWQDKQDN